MSKFKIEDVRIDTYVPRGYPHLGRMFGIRLTHMPSGYVENSEGDESQWKKREESLAKLKTKVEDE